MKTLNEHIEITPGTCGGKPRIAGRRIRVEDVAVWHERMRMSPDQIARDYDLSLGQVHAALAYYFDHVKEIEADIREGEAFVERMRKKSTSPLQRKLDELDERRNQGLHGRKRVKRRD